MKKLRNTASPFILLLFPLFLLMGVLLVNLDKEIPAEKQNVGLTLQTPTLSNFISAILK